MTSLKAIILANNEEHNITDAIKSLDWADEVIVFDSYSTDNTVSVAEQAGARVIQHAFENYGAQRNAALDAVEADWIFFLDADERTTPALGAEVRSKLDQPQRGWWVPRHNIIFGKLTRSAGWYPDYQLRLLHRDSARYDTTRLVHEVVVLDGDAGYLTEPLTHYNYMSAEQFHVKQRRYTDLEAKARYEAHHLPKPYTPLTGAVRQFLWRFLKEKGYTQGLHGLRLSLLMAYYEAQIWLKVMRLKRR